MEKLKKLLQKLKDDKTVIKEISSNYSILEILKVAVKEKMYDELVIIFHPIEINGELIQFYDYYSTIDCYYEAARITEEIPNEIIDKITKIDIEKLKKVKIKNSLPREISGNAHPIDSEDYVEFLAEPACLETMLYLYRNNIVTTMNDTECVSGEREENGICKVFILYDLLSEENKNVVDTLVSTGNAEIIDFLSKKTVSIFVPCTKDETIGEVSDKLLSISKKFKKQISTRGKLNEEELFQRLYNITYYNLANNKQIPNSDESYLDLFIRYIKEGLIKNIEGEIDNKRFINNELIATEEDEIYSLKDFLKVMKEIDPELFKSIYEKVNIYYDEIEDIYWESIDLYRKYIESKNLQQTSSKNTK